MENSRYYTKCVTAGRAAEGLRADWQDQLRELQWEIGFEYIRFHGIFHDDMGIYQEDENGKPKFYFGYFDKLFDFLLSVGIKPIMEFGFMPSQLATQCGTVFWWKGNGAPPVDYGKWAELVEATVRHAIDRYGIEEVLTWYFEVWNEPNLGSFWRGTFEEYCHLYEVSVEAVKKIDVRLRVGGPSTSGADFREDLQWLKNFIRFCDDKHLPIDFFSAHPYPTYWPLDTEGNKQMGYMKQDSTIQHLSMIREIVDQSPYPQAEIHLTEWNSSPSPRDLIHDTMFMAPFILYNISMNFQKVNSLGFWTFTDVFEEQGANLYQFHGGFGMMNPSGLKKPSYWAYYFLSKLGDEILVADENHLVSRTGDDYCVLIWNYCYYQDAFALGDRSKLTPLSRNHVFQDKVETVSFDLDLEGEYEEEVSSLNQDTSVFDNWVAMGAPEYPTKCELDHLKSISQPQRSWKRLSIPVGKPYSRQDILQPHEVKMIRLRKK
ncbi:MAG: GH39 family glycosyl hydrolase [Candidatus Merdivicinus sp.]